MENWKYSTVSIPTMKIDGDYGETHELGNDSDGGIHFLFPFHFLCLSESEYIKISGRYK